MNAETQDLHPMIAAEFRSLADLLSALPEAQWDTSSLCEGWRVREVVAHVTMSVRYSVAQFGAELEASGGDFTVLSNRVAALGATLPTATLVDNLRDEAMHQWRPPVGGDLGALTHVVVHGLDITVPLGAGRQGSGDAVRVVLENLTAGGGHSHFGFDLNGLRLEATDMDWTFGDGKILRGEAGDLALLLCGRTLPEGHVN